MFLFINNASDKISFSYFLDKTWSTKLYDCSRFSGLLSCIHDLLDKLSRSSADLQGIAVLVGKGSFTSTRVAVTVANTLAYAWRIPVVGVTEPQFEQLEELIRRQPVGQYILPSYSGEANIGK